MPIPIIIGDGAEQLFIPRGRPIDEAWPECQVCDESDAESVLSTRLQ